MKTNILKLAGKVTLKAPLLDVPYQNHRILRAGVNLHLADLFRSDRRNMVFPGKMENKKLILRNCDTPIDIDALTTRFDALQRHEELPPLSPLKELFDRADMKNADEVMVRLAGLCNPVRFCRSEIKLFSGKMPVAEQLQVLEEYDRQTTCQLARYFNLEDSPVSPLHLPSSSGIHPFYMYCFLHENGCLTKFHNSAGAVIYGVVRKKLFGHSVELPVTNYICGGGDEFPVYRMPDLGNGGMYPLYAWDKLVQYPETPVILTDILEIASVFNHSSPELLISSFYGGIDAVPKTDIRPLFGAQRKSFWLLLNPPHCTDPSATWRTGLKLLERFKSYDRNLYFLEPVNPQWSIPKNPDTPCSCKTELRELSIEQFLNRCCRLHIREAASFTEEEPQLLTGSEVNDAPDDEPFLAPIANKGGFVIFYASAKAGKTFLALHTALSMAYGKDPIPGHWTNVSGKPHRVLYISGEMTKGTFKKRKLREDAFLQPDASLLDNINFLPQKGRYIDDPGDQKFYDKAIWQFDPEMIVFDNWQTLSSSGATSRSAFDDFFRWISCWCERGIQILLVNHTNKSGNILGSGAQKGACDTSIRLYSASNDDQIQILITPEEFRDGKCSLFQPILASFDFDDPAKSDWKYEMPDKETIKKIRKGNEE